LKFCSCSANNFEAGQLHSQPSNYIGFHHPTCDLKSKVIIIASMASVTTLLLALLIVIVIRRQCRPIRPRIKKTYVLQKNVSPLNSTYRPTTEQCEITIEDCCNMTVCETVSLGCCKWPKDGFSLNFFSTLSALLRPQITAGDGARRSPKRRQETLANERVFKR
jgi:hypothetical protein